MASSSSSEAAAARSSAKAVVKSPTRVPSAHAARPSPSSKRIQRASRSTSGAVVALLLAVTGGVIVLGAIWLFKYGPLRHHASPPPEHAPTRGIGLSPTERETLQGLSPAAQAKERQRLSPVGGTYSGKTWVSLASIQITLTVIESAYSAPDYQTVKGTANISVAISAFVLQKTLNTSKVPFTIGADNTITVGADFHEQLKEYVTGLTLELIPSQNAIHLQGEVSYSLVHGSLNATLRRT